MNAAKRFVLSENTLVPLSFFVILAGAIYWLSGIQYATAQNRADIVALSESEERLHESISKSMERNGEILSQIQSQVSALDAKIQILVRYASSADSDHNK